jgi:hypothetical protein
VSVRRQQRSGRRHGGEARNRGRIDVRRAVRIQLRQLEWRPT